jgi:hypothetical protein
MGDDILGNLTEIAPAWMKSENKGTANYSCYYRLNNFVVFNVLWINKIFID